MQRFAITLQIAKTFTFSNMFGEGMLGTLVKWFAQDFASLAVRISTAIAAG